MIGGGCGEGDVVDVKGAADAGGDASCAGGLEEIAAAFEVATAVACLDFSHVRHGVTSSVVGDGVDGVV